MEVMDVFFDSVPSDIEANPEEWTYQEKGDKYVSWYVMEEDYPRHHVAKVKMEVKHMKRGYDKGKWRWKSSLGSGEHDGGYEDTLEEAMRWAKYLAIDLAGYKLAMKR